MATINTTTELNAVNTLLRSIFMAPLTSLSGDLGIDATMAQDTLHTKVRELCAEGWYFNTEHDYPITSNGSGEITVNSDIIHVDFPRRLYPETPVVLRGTKLYHLKEHSYSKFDANTTYKATIRLLLQFDELPEAAKTYVTYIAGQEFQADTIGDEALFKFDEKTANRARMTLEREEASQADYNIWQGDYIGQTPANALFRKPR